jgi:hypothetical protein
MSLLQSALNKLRGDGPAPAEKSTPSPTPQAEKHEMTQRFAQFVMMQAQQVMMMLGLTPSPYGQMPPQLPEAKIFIDQLEMIAQKTQGNLTAQEAALLAKIIEQCTMAFTKVSGGTPPSLMPSRSTPEIPLDELVGPMEEPEEDAPAPEPPPKRKDSPPAPSATTTPEKTSPVPTEDKKKYVKSYGNF